MYLFTLNSIGRNQITRQNSGYFLFPNTLWYPCSNNIHLQNILSLLRALLFTPANDQNFTYPPKYPETHKITNPNILLTTKYQGLKCKYNQYLLKHVVNIFGQHDQLWFLPITLLFQLIPFHFWFSVLVTYKNCKKRASCLTNNLIYLDLHFSFGIQPCHIYTFHKLIVNP